MLTNSSRRSLIKLPRTIVRYNTTKNDAKRATEEKEKPDIDGFFAKLQKYIPAEIVAAFLAVDYLLVNANPPVSGNWYWGVFAVLVLITPIYLWAVSILEKKDKPDYPQLVIAPIAFIIWAFALGGTVVSALPWYNKALAQVTVVLATLVIPLADTIVTHVLKYD
jgi:hypothetical protein